MTNPEEPKLESISKSEYVCIKPATREQFVSAITEIKQDKFAKTFVAKCDMLERWDGVQGYFSESGELMGAILVTYSKRTPTVANLQLLHTFHKHRGLGVGSILCGWAVEDAYYRNAEYFRVSSELDAMQFYKKIGFKFVGLQKTAALSMFRLTSPVISENNFNPDKFVWEAMNRKGKGGCIRIFLRYEGLDAFFNE